ncbi:putative basic amino acid antiporter YfcC [Corallincola holothuriorum]|uniref:Putative basic amino acid antiporter YfcC n=2 Tax=Corallincola holothuriorum TaxID=2282215 RepID=A0A368NJM6_9GAMM|nr:putative basic amino acid antiporter YfcC [Corallincola holothuriorum]
MPDAFVILFFVAVLALLLNYLLPAGQFTTDQQVINGSERTMIVPGSYTPVEVQQTAMPLFNDQGEIGLLNVPFEGLVAGSKWGSAIGVIAFILVIGGAFGMIMKTGAIHRGIMLLIERGGRFEQALLPMLFLLFSLGGAIFGMGEEAIAFCIILLPLLIRLGYDSITTVLVTYVATQIGFAASWMNPFSVAIAQGISGLPVMSGAPFRMGVWLVLTLFGLVFTLRYARKIKLRPESSLSYQSDRCFLNQNEQRETDSFNLTDKLILLVLALGMVWVIWGVIKHQYYIPQIASQFFAIGLLAALIAVFSPQNKLTANDASAGFKQGAAELLPAALVVGMAKGVVLLLGGDDPASPSILNSLLFYASSSIEGMAESVAAVLMLTLQSVFNFFIASGSGQAALTMPLMAPLSDLVGVSRQVAVLAFQLGDGLTNIIIPTSASLVGCLGVARLDWSIWFKFVWRLQLALLGLAVLAMITAVFLDYQ